MIGGVGLGLVLVAIIMALAPPDASPAVAPSAWSSSLEAFAYLLQDDPYVMPIVRADRGFAAPRGTFPV